MSMATNRKRTETPSSSPTELVRLDSVSMDEDDEILPDFEAEVDGRRGWVAAVLPRARGSAAAAHARAQLGGLRLPGFRLRPALRSEETLRSGKIRLCPNCGLFHSCGLKPPTSPREDNL